MTSQRLIINTRKSSTQCLRRSREGGEGGEEGRRGGGEEGRRGGACFFHDTSYCVDLELFTLP